MNCPGCNSGLDPSREFGVEIDVCNYCKAQWFDRGELEAYKKSASDKPSVNHQEYRFVPGSEKFRRCPRCQTETLQMGEIVSRSAGRCTECTGVWLDADREPSAWGLAIDSVGHTLGIISELSAL